MSRSRAEKREETMASATSLDTVGGVGGKELDSYGAIAREHALKTALADATRLAAVWGGKVLMWTYGESCIIVKIKVKKKSIYIGFNVEGLGTKILVADLIRLMPGFPGFSAEQLARLNFEGGVSAVAMSINDLITLGVMPLLYGQLVECGSKKWLQDLVRADAISDGVSSACLETGTIWGPGETAQYSGLVISDRATLGGGSLGLVPPDCKPIKPKRIKRGDRIIFLPSSGIHANGLSTVRDLVKDQNVELRYDTMMSDGRAFGGAILTPTRLYVMAVEALMMAGILPSYAINITGGGMRKLMRALRDLMYVVTFLPTPQPEFLAIQKAAGFSDREMYAAFNMGIGFAIIVRPKHFEAAMAILSSLGFEPMDGGFVSEGERSVELPDIEPYKGETLGVR